MGLKFTFVGPPLNLVFDFCLQAPLAYPWEYGAAPSDTAGQIDQTHHCPPEQPHRTSGMYV